MYCVHCIAAGRGAAIEIRMESSLPRFPQLLSVPLPRPAFARNSSRLTCEPARLSTRVGCLEKPWRATIRANCTVFGLHFGIRDPIVRILNGIKVNKLQALMQLGCRQTALMPNIILTNTNQHQPKPTYAAACKQDVSGCDMSPTQRVCTLQPTK